MNRMQSMHSMYPTRARTSPNPNVSVAIVALRLRVPGMVYKKEAKFCFNMKKGLD